MGPSPLLSMMKSSEVQLGAAQLANEEMAMVPTTPPWTSVLEDQMSYGCNWSLTGSKMSSILKKYST